MKAKIGRRLTDSETDKAAVLAAYIDGSPHEWPHAVSEVALVCHGYLDQQARIRELEAQLAETRANLAKADDDLSSHAYDLERQGRELAEARRDGARLDYVLSHAEGDVVIGDVSAEGFWDDMEAEHIGDEREHLRAWRRAIDSALEGKSDDKG